MEGIFSNIEIISWLKKDLKGITFKITTWLGKQNLRTSGFEKPIFPVAKKLKLLTKIPLWLRGKNPLAKFLKYTSTFHRK
jgi:hypothetical protein